MSSTTPGEQPTQNARNEVDHTGIISTTEQPTNNESIGVYGTSTVGNNVNTQTEAHTNNSEVQVTTTTSTVPKKRKRKEKRLFIYIVT